MGDIQTNNLCSGDYNADSTFDEEEPPPPPSSPPPSSSRTHTTIGSIDNEQHTWTNNHVAQSARNPRHYNTNTGFAVADTTENAVANNVAAVSCDDEDDYDDDDDDDDDDDEEEEKEENEYLATTTQDASFDSSNATLLTEKCDSYDDDHDDDEDDEEIARKGSSSSRNRYHHGASETAAPVLRETAAAEAEAKRTRTKTADVPESASDRAPNSAGADSGENSKASSTRVRGPVCCGIRMTRMRLFFTLVVLVVIGAAVVGVISILDVGSGGADDDNGEENSAQRGSNTLEGEEETGATLAPVPSPSPAPTSAPSEITSSPTLPTNAVPTISSNNTSPAPTPPPVQPTSAVVNATSAVINATTPTAPPTTPPLQPTSAVINATMPTAPPTYTPTTIPTTTAPYPPTSIPTPPPSTPDPTMSYPPFSFYLMGDIPYTPKERTILTEQVLELNALYQQHNSHFVIFVGDMGFAKRTDCIVENHYLPVRQALLSLSIPTLVLAGDNDWNDCPDPDVAWSNFLQHFVPFENQWSNRTTNATTITPGITPLGNVERSPLQPENFAFVHHGILFLSVNLVGGTVHDQDEWDLRTQRNINWTSAVVDRYFDTQTATPPIPPTPRAVFIFGHAMRRENNRPYFEGIANIFLETLGESKNGDTVVNATYKPGREVPVLYMHGDGHHWILGTQFSEQLGWRLYRDVQVDQGAKAPPIRVEIRGSNDAPFLVERVNDQFVLGDDGLIRIDRRGGLYLNDTFESRMQY